MNIADLCSTTWATPTLSLTVTGVEQLFTTIRPGAKARHAQLITNATNLPRTRHAEVVSDKAQSDSLSDHYQDNEFTRISLAREPTEEDGKGATLLLVTGCYGNHLFLWNKQNCYKISQF